MSSKKIVDYPNALNRVIESPSWPEGLEARTHYDRIHDDHDGEFRGTLSVVIGDDGDAWVSIFGENDGLRFRTFGGGGSSLRVRNALVALAEAIRRDNEEHPVIIPVGTARSILATVEATTTEKG